MDIIKRNNVVVSGKGEKVILFAHGYGCDQKMWRFVAPAFEENYKVILFDHVGSGKSDWNSYSPKKYSTLQGYADEITKNNLSCTFGKFHDFSSCCKSKT